MKLLAAALLVTTVVAQEAKPAAIRGAVVNALTGEPISRAVVTLAAVRESSDAAQSVTADRQGVFEIPKIAMPGTYTLSAAKPGYVGDLQGGGGVMIAVDAGASLDSIQVKLTPLGIVTGRVTDEEGEPLRHAVVTLRRIARHTNPRAQDDARVDTNDLGEFRAADLRPGRYIVEFWYEPRGPKPAAAGGSQKNSEGYQSVYFPGVQSIDNAVPIEVTAGSMRSGVDVQLTKVPTFLVSGELRAIHVAGAEEISLELRGGLQWRSGRVSRVNLFEFDRVSPGHFTLMAQAGELYAMAPVNVIDRDVTGVAINLVRRFPITGHISWAGAGIHVEPIPQGSLGTFEDAQVAGDGSFTIPGMVPWKMSIHVDGLSDQDYLKSIRYGDVTIEDGTFDTVPGAELVIEVRHGAASIAGDVKVEDKPRAAATVVLVHAKHRNWPAFNKMTVSDQNGQFSFAGVAPGGYELYAFDTIEDGAWSEPGFAEKYHGRAERIQVVEKGQVRAALKLIEAIH